MKEKHGFAKISRNNAKLSLFVKDVGRVEGICSELTQVRRELCKEISVTENFNDALTRSEAKTEEEESLSRHHWPRPANKVNS